MTTAEKCKVFVEDIKAYWDYTLITNYGWVLLIKDDYLRASIGEAFLKGVDDKIITRLTKLYVLIEGHDDLINLFTENQNFALEVIEHLLQKGFSFTVGSMLTDSRRVVNDVPVGENVTSTMYAIAAPHSLDSLADMAMFSCPTLE